MAINEILENADAGTFTKRQVVFLKYTYFVLIDLMVLNLFDEFWDLVVIDIFSISLLTAVLLQILMQVTLAIEHRIANYFKKKPGISAKILRGLATWFVLFSSKLIILWAIHFCFGEDVSFAGPVHGLVAFITVVIGIIVAEQVFFKIYRSLA